MLAQGMVLDVRVSSLAGHHRRIHYYVVIIVHHLVFSTLQKGRGWPIPSLYT